MFILFLIFKSVSSKINSYSFRNLDSVFIILQVKKPNQIAKHLQVFRKYLWFINEINLGEQGYWYACKVINITQRLHLHTCSFSGEWRIYAYLKESIKVFRILFPLCHFTLLIPLLPITAFNLKLESVDDVATWRMQGYINK